MWTLDERVVAFAHVSDATQDGAVGVLSLSLVSPGGHGLASVVGSNFLDSQAVELF